MMIMVLMMGLMTKMMMVMVAAQRMSSGLIPMEGFIG